MRNLLHTAWQWLSVDLRRFAALISVILSIWVILTNDTLNIDGVLYLDAAYYIGNGDWKTASEIYRWNFYPILIALLSKISFLKLEVSAFLINSLFFAGIAWLFLSILQILGASRQVLIAGLVIISIHPYINEYRADILRDPGFLFFLLWALSLLIKAYESGKYRYGITLGLAFIIATLFRIEGTAFLLLAPIVLLFNKDHTINIRLRLFASAYLIPSGCILLLLLAWTISGNSLPMGRLGEPLASLKGMYQSLMYSIPAKGEIIATEVLNRHSDDFGVIGILAILISILVLQTVKRITLFFLILGLYAKLKIKIKRIPILLWLSMINISYMAVFIIKEFFLSSRFAMPISLFIALPASFALARIFQDPTSGSWKTKLIRITCVFFVVLMLLDGLVSFGTSKYYLRNAGYWLEKNMKQNEILLTNHRIVSHYAGIRMPPEEKYRLDQFNDDLNNNTITAENIKHADYIAIRVKHVDPMAIFKINDILGQGPIKVFSETDKETLIIFHNKK